ncbi:MAG: ABC transporter ATP-binding protein [Bacteroidales bacterium]|nr:ABC transporter ATP-binding protein [Bacteroidales bacterium]
MITATGIEKTFGSLKVLKGIDFRADGAEVVSIVGASGAGKSTLLQILGSLSDPTAGKVTIDGVDIFSLSSDELADFRNRKIGFVFQFHHLLPEFTALENVMIPALIAGSSAPNAKSEAKRLLTDMGLGERFDHKPSELSGGEQQRVAIARAIINKPAVLFADEPSGNLDSNTKKDIHQLFFDLRDKYGLTVIIVTHDKDLAKMSDRMIEMSDGKIVDGVLSV